MGLFNKWKKKVEVEPYRISAPVAGKVIDIKDTNDQVFNSEALGKGVGIIASEKQITAPIGGQIVSFFPTKHAVGIKTDKGVELLIHVGIDTVELNGKHFISMKKQGDTVVRGDILLKVDFDAIREDFKKKEDRELELSKKDGVKESLITRRINELSQLADGLKKKKDDLILEKHKLKIESDNLKENLDRLNELEERLEELYEREEEIRKLEYSIKLATSKLDEAYEELKEEVTPKLENEIKESIKKSTNNKYQNVIYNENDGILVQNYLGDIVALDKLSIGTIDQAYLGFRMAIAKEVADLPIILDESFAFYDDERLDNILKELQKESKDRQIIILSCSEREKKALKSCGIEYNLVKM